jgi:GTP diphosphokinase / guanosine-3',5'-bis(diphosphate) 3'-diphosphatase
VPPQEREKAKNVFSEERQLKESSTRKSGIKVQGLVNVMVGFAKCCNPLPGDPIKGFITRGRGVTVHKADCINLQATDTLRIVDVSWDEDQSLSRVVRLGIQASNKTGLLATISKVFANNESDIVQANMKKINEEQAQGTFMVSVRNVEHLTRIMNALKSIKEVENVERLGTL